MDVPKPHPPKVAVPVERVKQPYVRKPHLTDKPFRNHEGLQALRQKQMDSMFRSKEEQKKHYQEHKKDNKVANKHVNHARKR